MATVKERLKQVKAQIGLADKAYDALTRAVKKNNASLMRRELRNLRYACERCIEDMQGLEVRATLWY